MANEILLNLPEGSRRRAVFAGAQVEIAPAENETFITVHAGEVLIIDEAGFVRAKGRAADDGAILKFESRLDRDEVAFRMFAEDEEGNATAVQAELDWTSGVPENEEDPPHGATRWQLFTPDSDDDPYRFKMQWIYEMARLRAAGEGVGR